MIKRYAVAEYEQIPAMDVTSDGPWVKWEDYVKEVGWLTVTLAARDSEIARLQREKEGKAIDNSTPGHYDWAF